MQSIRTAQCRMRLISSNARNPVPVPVSFHRCNATDSRFGQRTGCSAGSKSKRLPEGPDGADQSWIAQRLVGCICKCGAGVHVSKGLAEYSVFWQIR